MTQPAPLFCDMRGAPDTPQERTADYRRLFQAALVGRDREERMVRFRFDRSAVDEAAVRSLVARERVCCPFFDIRLSTAGDELWWETRVDPLPGAPALLEEIYLLPDRVAEHDALADDLVARGVMRVPERARADAPVDTVGGEGQGAG